MSRIISLSMAPSLPDTLYILDSVLEGLENDENV